MYWRKAIVALALFLCGCSTLNPEFSSIYHTKPNNDLDIINAYFMIEDGKIAKASEIFYELYQNSKDEEFLKESAKLALSSRSNLLYKIMDELKGDDVETLRLKIGYAISIYELDEAKKLALKLIKKDRSSQNYILLANIYAFEDNQKKSIQLYKKAYEIDKSEDNMVRLMSIFNDFLGDSKSAINIANSWIEQNGCAHRACYALLDLYSNLADFDNMVRIYEKLYLENESSQYLVNALEVLLYKEDYKGAKNLLKKYEFNDDLLAQIHAQLGEYKEAYNLAARLFEFTNNIEYKAKMAIYKYELSKTKEIELIIKLFEESVYELDNSLYYNYYGYLLIDHNIDIAKGLELALKAYALDPKSAYIADSVAWGYYKLKRCDEAMEWIDKITPEYLEQKEFKAHYNKIKKCIKEKR
ncbi:MULTISPECIES: lipopolysaccharide assembly protein LapB [Campylobacter]|uniref:ATP-dependent nuclease subunit B n=1 Tax=Campylobacter vicugnae TaxID=1660076 RepID=A0ABZ2E985_9BACT|nr:MULTISPECIES: hypothetical protein [unclassified Campylobacter]ARR03754.1 putative tetratricopeptide repeat lipoprotein [Campylobacter sp. RM12175]MCR8689343.1 hypothetical protein [Campylobacter sp. RM9264]MCR8701066.1 hypothetical protein [Campylobacter sp. RM12176]